METRFFTPNSVPAVRLVDLDAAVQAATEAAGAPMHDPPLEPRDEAVFLLTAAAEIEHALMAQHLFAAYSVRVEGPRAADLTIVRDRITQIAREEMGHLVTVQNLLHLVGGALHLGRDSSRSTGAVAPFRFALERLTLGSLAKYVTAESPGEVPSGMPPDDTTLLARIDGEAVVANGGQPVHHVGAIFARLRTLFADELTDDDLQIDTAPRHATFADWGYQPRKPEDGEALIVLDLPGTDPGALRTAAVDAITAIGAQGEGFDVATSGEESHFERFFALYKLAEELIADEVSLTWPVVRDPNTTPAGGTGAMQDELDAAAGAGRIAEPRARAWAQLFDLRYRMLLGLLNHFLHLDQPRYSADPGPSLGDRTARGMLLIWAFDEMRHLSRIAALLVRMPKDTGGTEHAGPPFELPYTVALPATESARWRMHLDVSRAAVRLVRDVLQPRATPNPDPFLDDVVARDDAVQRASESLARGAGIPADVTPSGFAKAVTVLEEAVRGFRIGAHQNFWADVGRDDFLEVNVFGQTPIGLEPDGTPDVDPDHSPLITRLKASSFRMPLDRPAVPDSRVGYLEDWIRDGSPDDDPPGAVGVHDERLPLLPTSTPSIPQGPVPGFAADVRPLFRDTDQQSMTFLFDLFSVDDVRTHATAIQDALTAGLMPCDGAWSADKIDVFRRWIDGGMQA